MGSEAKTCTSCEETKPLAEFYYDATNDTYKARCKRCHNTKDTEAKRARRTTPEQYDSMRSWATPTEREVVDALIKAGDVVGAAGELGMTVMRVRAHLGELARRAASRGWSPANDMTKPTPDGYHVKGVSTYYSKNKVTGELETRGQWVKTQKDAEHRLEALMSAVQTLAEPIKGLADPVPVPVHLDADLLAVYPMGDPHIGMFAWAVETGADDHDLVAGERDLVDAVDHLVGLAPPAEQALIINLGDFFHADSKENRTARSGHALDVDTRWPKVLQVGIKIMRRNIDRALEKHARVRVINVVGNHDDHTAIMLSVALANYYEREPRVEIDTGPGKFHWYRFGDNLLGAAHGDACKVPDLPGVMANDRAREWGETVHRAFYTGHIHHDTLKEYPGVIVETFRTLAPRDSYHAGAGYRSGQDMKLDIWHRTDGRILRHTVGIAQLRRKQRAA